MVNYQNGKIYKIVNSVNNTIYIGSTCRELSARMARHRASAKGHFGTAPFHTAMRDIGIHCFRILLIKLFPCSNKAELVAEEYAMSNKFIASGTSIFNAVIGGHMTQHNKRQLYEANFIRGCLRIENNHGFMRWKFEWYNDGLKCSKSFSFIKYGGEQEAKRLAIAYQDMIYPINDDPLAFNKEFIERRVLKKMIQFREEFYPLADRGLIEVRASEKLIQYYERMVEVFQKHLDRSVDTDNEQRMQRFMNKALYAQEHAESYRTIIVQ